MKINTIEIHNYRAFYLSTAFQINGKNVLIYGENGSGKSSLYHALEYFFKAAHDLVPIQEQQNIFYNSPPTVKIKMDSGQSFEYKDNRTLPSENFLKDVHYHNPFFTYRRLLRTYLTETDDSVPNLFSLFLNTILRYYKNSADQKRRTFGEAWKILQDALKSGVMPPEEQKAIDTIRDEFNDGLQTFLHDLQTRTNQWLQDYFDHHVKISLEQATMNITDSDGTVNTFYEPEILLKLKYFGTKVPDPYYKFLNEARLSALAVSLYLASLKTISEPPDFKLLFLDDIFIGLDTSNRLPLLNILQKEFSEYQIFLTTYDKYWFELARDWFTRKTKDQWTFLEMYVDDQSGFEVPRVIPTQGYLKKAEDYLASHDYPACGMYLRKETEQILSALLKPAHRIKETPLDDKTKNYGTKEKNLNDRILALKDFCDEEQLNYEDFEDIAIYKDVLLNPLSHHDIEAPIYKSELRAIIAVLKELEKIEVKEIPRTSGKDFILRIEKPTGEFLSVEFRTRELILLIKEPTKNARLLRCCKCEQLSIDNNGIRSAVREVFLSLHELYRKACQTFGVSESNNLPKIVSLQGKTLEEIIVESSLF